MKRVLIFSLAYHPFVGGAEVAIKEITDRLDTKEYVFEMITLRFDRNLPKVEHIGNIIVYRVGFSVRGAKVSDRSLPFFCKVAKVLFPLTSFLKASSLHRRGAYNMVWAMMANQAGFGALFFSWYAKVPMVLELQDGHAFQDMKSRQPVLRLLWSLYRKIYMHATVVKCISNFIAKELSGIGYGGRVEIIPNGVDVAKFSAPVPQEKQRKLKGQFGKSEGDIFLFTASRLVLSRGVEDIIHALSRLPLQVKLLIAGEGEDKAKLQHMANEIGVSERVIFAGYVSHNELPALLSISDIFVRPSIIEGMGNAFIEAFAAGVPIIGTPVGGIPDFLFDGKTGIFCQVRDPASIAKAVERYLGDSILMERVVENARELAAEKYDWRLIALAMEDKIFSRI